MRLLIMRAPHRIAPAMINGEAKKRHNSSAGPMVKDMSSPFTDAML